MWFIEALSAVLGPTVANYVQTVLTCILGFFILLWKISPVVFIVFVIVLIVLFKFSEKIGTLVMGLGTAYAAYSFDHPIIALIIGLATFQAAFSSDSSSADVAAESKDEAQAEETPKNPIPDEALHTNLSVFSPCNGTVLSVNVEPDNEVDVTHVIMIIESTEGLVEVFAPRKGTVSKVFVTDGAAVKAGDELVQF